ncbi:DUF2845 domain-containing protein [Pseudomonas tohonis]|uniref:DUF2845 domain-containing protein n=1 Tax=Pseudomonas tohonis TaxID=2725477 RepID=UPI0022F0B793|nr:DUF2845 domain-containing protein [Pseudomonas tohonis]
MTEAFVKILPLLALPLLLAAASVQASSTLRCEGGGLISQDDSTSQVQRKCGDPASRSNLGYREKVDRYGNTSEVLVEEWVYGPRNGMYQYLRFEGNKLIKIESKRGD